MKKGLALIPTITASVSLSLVTFSCSANSTTVINVTGVDIALSEVNTVLPTDTFTLEYSISPVDATNQAVEGSSDNPDSVSVDDNGHINVLNVGSANITVSTVDGSFTDTCLITVKDMGIGINQGDKVVLYTGYTLPLTYTSDEQITNITGSSDNDDIATVDPVTGVVTAVNEGTTTITVKTNDGNNLYDTCTVEVKENTPLCFEKDPLSTTNPVIGYQILGSTLENINIEYSYTSKYDASGKKWDGQGITLDGTKKLYVRNTTNTLSTDDSHSFNFTITDGTVIASGNVDSMVNFSPLTDYCFYYLFCNCNSLIKAPDLPATTLANNCYSYMFYNCQNLVEGPSILPANNLAENCYESMFETCPALTKAPILPAMNLAKNGYLSMFENCSSLRASPTLPASQLIDECYTDMFYSCPKLCSLTVGFGLKDSQDGLTTATEDGLGGVANIGLFKGRGALDGPITKDQSTIPSTGSITNY